MSKKLLNRLHLTLWTVLVLLLGYLLGSFLLTVERVAAPAPVRIARVRSPRAPFVHVREISNGRIIGTVGTGARLVIGKTVVVPEHDRTFEIAASPFLVNVIDVPVPHGALFVASRRGKNYYPVAARAAERLKPENRIYFRTGEEAEEMGYKRGF